MCDCVCVHVCVHVRVFVCVCVCVYVHVVCVCVCVCVCLCVCVALKLTNERSSFLESLSTSGLCSGRRKFLMSRKSPPPHRKSNANTSSCYVQCVRRGGKGEDRAWLLD